jgi:hypothetical protein
VAELAACLLVAVSSLGLNPDIAQKSEMADITKGTLARQKIYRNKLRLFCSQLLKSYVNCVDLVVQVHTGFNEKIYKYMGQQVTFPVFRYM